jgi:hypothetical protein
MAVRCVASNHDLAEIGGAWAKTWKNRRSEERDLRYSLLIERTAEFEKAELCVTGSGKVKARISWPRIRG